MATANQNQSLSISTEKTSPTAPSVAEMTVEQLGQSIREKHAQMLRAFKASVVTAIEVGELLIDHQEVAPNLWINR
jgi:hypothetical protein